MDPSQLDGVSLIIGALAAGAGEGIQEATKQAVLGARDKLTRLLKPRFRDNEDAAADLNVYLRRPTPANAELLAGHIVSAGLDRDQEILTVSRQLLELAGPTATGSGSLAAESINQINTNGGTGFVGGQHVHHHQTPISEPAADWDLLHVRGSLFELRNIGTGPAHDVILDAPGAVRFDAPDNTQSVWPRGSGHEFFAAGSLQSGHPRLVVQWKNTPDDPMHRTWERPLPR